MNNSICIIEATSVSAGYKTVDAMTKMAGINIFFTGVINPGRFVIMAEADEASIQAAYDAGLEACGQWLLDSLLLFNLSPAILKVIGKIDDTVAIDALGILEVKTITAAIRCADAALKGAAVDIITLKINDALHGHGFFVISGTASDVETAVEVAANQARSTKAFINSDVFQNPAPQLVNEIMKR